MTALLERKHTVLPPAEPLDDLYALLSRTGSDPATLPHPDGDRLVLPREILELLSNVVEVMARGQAVTIAPAYQLLTTRQAAGLIGVSRPTFVKLLDTGALVTFKIADFPDSSVACFEIDVVHPADFLLDLLDLAPGMVLDEPDGQARENKRRPRTLPTLLDARPHAAA